MSRLGRRTSILLATAVVGCATNPPGGPQGSLAHRGDGLERSASGSTQKLTLDELDQVLKAYADRYNVLVGSAIDQIVANNPDPLQRRTAGRIQLNGLLALNDIVSSDDPYAQALDLVVMVTLQSHVWIDEAQAQKVFGPRAPILIQALREARIEAWDIAARLLTEEQLETVDYLIWDWRRKNPGIEQVEFVKFQAFAEGRGAAVVNQLKAGGGFLAPLSDTNLELREYRRLAERAFWYGKRAPSLAGLQAQAAASEILAAPEIGKLIESANRATDAGDRVSRTIVQMPDLIRREREAVLKAIDDRTDRLQGVMAQTRLTVDDATRLSESINQLTLNLNALVTHVDGAAGKYVAPIDPHSPPPPATRPFDIAAYAAAIGKANEVVAGLNQLANNTDKLARSDGWRHGLEDVSDAADRRVRVVFTNVYIVMGVAFALMLLYRAVSLPVLHRLRQRFDHGEGRKR